MVVCSDATLLAPEEVFNKKKVETVAKSERTQSEKKALRAAKKTAYRKREKQREKERRAVVRLNPSAPAAATSIVQTGVYGGGFIGPVGFGFLAAQFSFPIAWLVGAVTMLVAAVLMFVGRRMLVAHRAAREAAPSLTDAA